MGPTAAATTLATARGPPGAGAETAENREHRPAGGPAVAAVGRASLCHEYLRFWGTRGFFWGETRGGGVPPPQMSVFPRVRSQRPVICGLYRGSGLDCRAESSPRV